MAIWPFNRKKTEDSTLPQEVQNYYQAEKRERAGVAGLLAVGTLLVTVLLALGLFFGGRWVYRTVFDNDNNADTTAQNNGEQQPVSPESDNDATTSPDSTPATPTPDPTPAPNPSAAAPTPTPTPNSGDRGSSELVNTGPGDVLAIFLGVVVLASLAHYELTAPKN